MGYYLAARLLWDVDEAQRLDGLVDDFLTRAFGPAKGPMAEFYRQLAWFGGKMARLGFGQSADRGGGQIGDRFGHGYTSALPLI